MFGVGEEEMQHVGDDRIGRALDRLFDTDRAALLTEIVVAIGQRFGVKFDEFHNDSTTVSFYGSYRAASGQEIRGRTAPAITYGHSKIHRPAPRGERPSRALLGLYPDCTRVVPLRS